MNKQSDKKVFSLFPSPFVAGAVFQNRLCLYPSTGLATGGNVYNGTF